MVGDGKNTRVGLDPIPGMDSSFTLPRELRDYLEDYGITSLAHARNYSPEAPSYWLTATDLDLGGDWYHIWNDYIRGLEHGRIRLGSKPDCLLWSYKTYTCTISVALAYECVADHYLDTQCEAYPLHRALWNLKIPEKLRCFIWLLTKNRVLTWEQLKKWGFQGPSLCYLCKKNEESTQHLFMDCNYTKNAFAAVFDHFGSRSLHKNTVGFSVSQ